MSLPDGAEYWWDIRGHKYGEGKHRSKPARTSPIVSIEEMLEKGDRDVRLSTLDKTSIKRTLRENGFCESAKGAHRWMASERLSYRDVLVMLRAAGIEVVR